MERIGVRELRQHASRWLQRVRAGESFAITVRGRVVGRLVPAEPSSGLDRLIEGQARPASADFVERLSDLGKPPQGGPLSLELERLRADER